MEELEKIYRFLVPQTPEELVLGIGFAGNEMIFGNENWTTTNIGVISGIAWNSNILVLNPIFEHMRIDLTYGPEEEDCRVHFYTWDIILEQCGFTCDERFLRIIAKNSYRNNYVFVHSQDGLSIPGSNQPIISLKETDRYMYMIYLKYAEGEIQNTMHDP